MKQLSPPIRREGGLVEGPFSERQIISLHLWLFFHYWDPSLPTLPLLNYSSHSHTPVFLSLSHTDMNTHSYTCIHTYIHTHTHAHTGWCLWPYNALTAARLVLFHIHKHKSVYNTHSRPSPGKPDYSLLRHCVYFPFFFSSSFFYFSF